MPWELLARAETHELRISILEVLSIDGRRTLSPKELTYELQMSMPAVNYHMTALLRARVVRLAHERPVGGAIEHFYCLLDHSAEDLFERI
jgi:DNA-binding transcriptional ArsR family regulator